MRLRFKYFMNFQWEHEVAHSEKQTAQWWHLEFLWSLLKRANYKKLQKLLIVDKSLNTSNETEKEIDGLDGFGLVVWNTNWSITRTYFKDSWASCSSPCFARYSSSLDLHWLISLSIRLDLAWLNLAAISSVSVKFQVELKICFGLYSSFQSVYNNLVIQLLIPSSSDGNILSTSFCVTIALQYGHS